LLPGSRLRIKLICNLYGNSMSCDGRTPAINSATLLSAGSATFVTPAADATAISIAMAEDAYKDDGQKVGTGGSITPSHVAGRRRLSISLPC
jgi:hypothetical protein